MKLYYIVLLVIFISFSGDSQGNRVFSGGEAVNCGVVDISAVDGITWSTERSARPGYFSVVDTAVYIGCSDDAHINGYVKKYGNTSFIFPVGNGRDIRTLEISAPQLKTDAYAAAWIPGDPSQDLDPTWPWAGRHSVFSMGVPISAVYTGGQWDWQFGANGNLGNGTTGTGAGLTVTVSIPDLSWFASTQNLRLVGWNGLRWIDLSGRPTATGNTENSRLSGIMAANITAIGIGKVETSLSVKLEDFNATGAACEAILNWTSYNEQSTELFIIEQSQDAIHFETITVVKASGVSSGDTYQINIAQSSPLMYYRLKIKDHDGTYTYSAIIFCRTTCKVDEYMYVYPNPVSIYELINLNFSTNYSGRAELAIFNNIGHPVLSKQIEVVTGQNVISTDISNYSPGTYFMILLNMDGNQIGSRQKFIIQ